MCLWIYQGGKALPTFYWNAAYLANRGQFSLIFYTTIIFGEILELYYLETLKKTRLEIFCYQKQYRQGLQEKFSKAEQDCFGA